MRCVCLQTTKLETQIKFQQITRTKYQSNRRLDGVFLTIMRRVGWGLKPRYAVPYPVSSVGIVQCVNVTELIFLYNFFIGPHIVRMD